MFRVKTLFENRRSGHGHCLPVTVFPMQCNEMQQIDSAKATGACRTSDIHLGFLDFSFFPSPARLLYHTNLMTLQCYSALEMGSLI